MPWEVSDFYKDWLHIFNKVDRTIVAIQNTRLNQEDKDIFNHIVNCVNFCGEYSDEFLQEMTLEALINHQTYIKKIRQRDTLYIVWKETQFERGSVFQTWNYQEAEEKCEELNDDWYNEYCEMPFTIYQIDIPEKK